ncbi:MAG TPA: AAA family ATPase [Solirubrobacteraceae bacterium]|nr:AAA family ATPase [Solirubrobacteraceae bacterium]
MSNSQIAVGEKMVQHNYGPGSTVTNIVEGEVQGPRERPKPISALPRDVPQLYGRRSEIDRARSTMGCGDPIQFCGPSGLGKTTLLRHLSHRPEGHFRDGVIYYRSRRESLDDLLMRIFEFLYESVGTTKVKPTTAELATHLGAINALLLLDDVDLEREDLETLLLTLPRSVFVFGSPQRSLWSEGEAIRLRGLPEAAALTLVEDELGRPLSVTEGADFTQLCRALEGHPLQLKKAVAQIIDEGVTATQLYAQATRERSTAATQPAHQLTAQLANALAEDHRRVLALLAASDGAPLHVDHVAAIAAVPDAAAILAELEDHGLAQSHSPRYSATAPIAALQHHELTDRWRSSLLAYLIDHAEHHRDRPQRLRDDLEPIITSLRWAAGRGLHADVVRLARASDAVAESAGLWGAWRSILEIALQSARLDGDRGGEAWALHQLGTRALCLELTGEAAVHLLDALRIREQIGDKVGAAATRQNLTHLPGAPPPPNHDAPGGGPPGGGGAAMAVGSASVTGVIGVCILAISGAFAGGVTTQPKPARLSKPTPVVAHPLPAPHDPGTGSSPVDVLPAEQPTSPAPHARRQEPPRPQPHVGPTADTVAPDDDLGNMTAEDRDEGTTDASSDPDPSSPPTPPTPPTPRTAADGCAPGDLAAALANLVHREVRIAQLLLAAVPVPHVLSAQIDAVQRLLVESGLHCTLDEILTQLGLLQRVRG